MLKRFLYVLFAGFVISACSPSPEQLTSTAVAAQTQTKMAAPTVTFTPSPTFTPTPTVTPTATPTPLGGGSGILLFTANPFYGGDTASEKDGIYTINSDSTGLRQVLSRSQIESIVGGKYERASYLSQSGQNYISADGYLYAVTDNRELIRKIDLPKIVSLWGFSPDGKYILYEQGDRKKYIASIDGIDSKQLFEANDSFTGWSADGRTIYYRKDYGRSMWAVNIDGSNKHELQLTALKDYKPYEDVSSMGDYLRRLDSFAVAPDKTQVAFTWNDLLFVADAADLEFSNPRLILRLPGSDSDFNVIASSLTWSPDNNNILIKLTKINYSGRNAIGDVILVSLTDGKMETLYSSTEYDYRPCGGFSPDGKQVALCYDNGVEKKSTITLISLFDKSLITLLEFDRRVWLMKW